MKKYFLIFTIILLAGTCTFADEWDDYLQVDNEAKNQYKTVTPGEFEKVMSELEKNKKGAKQDAKRLKKMGNPMMEQGNTDNTNVLNTLYDTYPTLMVPLHLITPDNTEIPPGFYRIMSVVKPYGNYMNFYQGNSLIARVRSYDTQNDYNQNSLNYAKIIPVNDKLVKFIYGDIDCNLEVMMKVK